MNEGEGIKNSSKTYLSKDMFYNKTVKRVRSIRKK